MMLFRLARAVLAAAHAFWTVLLGGEYVLRNEPVGVVVPFPGHRRGMKRRGRWDE